MEPMRIIAGCIVSLIAVLLGIYVSFTIRGKGPILSNSYLLLNKEDRAKADKKAEYKLISVIFGCLSAAFLFLSLHIFTLWKWTYVLMWLVIAFTIIYAIVNAVNTVHKNQK